jgi:hypothetical protein
MNEGACMHVADGRARQLRIVQPEIDSYKSKANTHCVHNRHRLVQIQPVLGTVLHIRSSGAHWSVLLTACLGVRV